MTKQKLKPCLLKKCIICKKLTKGSVGKAGIRWTIICQKCKDNEDNEYAKIINNVISSVDMICKCLGGDLCQK